VADAPAADGPFALIVFNHGQQVPGNARCRSRPGPEPATWWRHPPSADGEGRPGAAFANDIEGELGTPFVVKSIDDQMSDLVDVDHLALAGHSSGAIVAYGTRQQLAATSRRPRRRAAGVSAAHPLAGEYSDDLKGTPVLFMHGDADLTPATVSRPAYDEAEAPKFFLSIPGGDHSAVYRRTVSAQAPRPRRLLRPLRQGAGQGPGRAGGDARHRGRAWARSKVAEGQRPQQRGERQPVIDLAPSDQGAPPPPGARRCADSPRPWGRRYGGAVGYEQVEALVELPLGVGTERAQRAGAPARLLRLAGAPAHWRLAGLDEPGGDLQPQVSG
jgi:hypothetical protein